MSMCREVLSLLVISYSQVFAQVEPCPGALHMPGHGSVELVATQWNVPGEPAGSVQLVDGRIQPEMNGRAYFANECEPYAYNNEAYLSLKLLGKKLSFTTDVSGAGCGCNAAMYLVPLALNTEETPCEDFYCDANGVCNAYCHEIDIMEANSMAWHSTLHKAYDSAGNASGYGGWVTGQFAFTAATYGPKSRCINTKKPFRVSASFPVGPFGRLSGMQVVLSQNGCSTSTEITRYNADDGFLLMTAALKKGVTPVVSYWSSKEMHWLDGPGAGGGPCRRDSASCSTKTPQFYDFVVEELSS